MAEENVDQQQEALQGELIGDDFFADGGSNSDSAGGFGTHTEVSDGTWDQLVNGQGKTSSGEVPWNPYSSDRVLGLPLYYNDLADPGGRIYNQTIIQDIPNVYIVPGNPRINRKLINVAGKRIVPADLSRILMKAAESGGPLGFALKGSFANGEDLRFMGFDSDYAGYFKYVQTMLSTIHSYMAMDDVFDIYNFEKEFENSIKDFGLCFYADKSTSITETADNTYGASRVAELANEKAATMREADFMFPTGGQTARVVDSIKAMNPIGVLQSLGTFDGIITRTSNALFRVVNGSQLFFPDMWQDSRFDKSYNISFKFYSPYGDKTSIFRYVYVPFIALLAMALPKQDGLLGYEKPFVMKMMRPGYFDINMGVVTSMSITKGGADSLWTVDGFPQMIEVNMNVVDLYPQMVQTDDVGMLSYNIGISNFLQNMAGIRSDQLSFLGFKAMINRMLSNSMLFTFDETIENKTEDFIYEVQNKVNNLFR
jgi:hypothetical protein